MKEYKFGSINKRNRIYVTAFDTGQVNIRSMHLKGASFHSEDISSIKHTKAGLTRRGHVLIRLKDEQIVLDYSYNFYDVRKITTFINDIEEIKEVFDTFNANL